MYEPSTILIVNTAFPPTPKSNLVSIIEEELPDITIEPLDRKYWSEGAGLEFIQALVFREDVEAINVAIEGNFYATCSFAAVGSIFSWCMIVLLIFLGYKVHPTLLSADDHTTFAPHKISTIRKHHDD